MFGFRRIVCQNNLTVAHYYSLEIIIKATTSAYDVRISGGYYSSLCDEPFNLRSIVAVGKRASLKQNVVLIDMPFRVDDNLLF